MSENIHYFLSLNYSYQIHRDDDGTVMIEYPDLKAV